MEHVLINDWSYHGYAMVLYREFNHLFILKIKNKSITVTEEFSNLLEANNEFNRLVQIITDKKEVVYKL